CWRSKGSNDSDLASNQISRQARQPLVFALCPAVFDRHISSLDEAKFVQAFLEGGHQVCPFGGRPAIEEANDRQRCLLRARRKRPRRGRAAEQRDEHAPSHSITSSARPTSGSGTLRPSALAVFMLMTSSTLVACWTVSSAGFSPLRIRPV